MTPFFGHAAEAALFGEAMASTRMHHAWLLAGPRGVGKARFADAAALRLLADAAGPPIAEPGFAVPETHRIAHLIAAGSHPDFARLERLTNDKTGALARGIAVDQVRGLHRLFSTTPTFSDRRVVIVDAVDDLDRFGANALLKTLEEPPAGTVFLLVSHAPGRLLPTVRSRCRLLRFGGLDDVAMTAALGEAMPEASAAEIAALVPLGDGSPGRALGFAGLDVAALDDSMTRLIREGDPTNGIRSTLARALATKAAQPRYELFLDRAPTRIATEAKALSGDALARALKLWEQARALASSAVPLSFDAHAVVFELGGMLAALAPDAQPLAKSGARR